MADHERRRIGGAGDAGGGVGDPRHRTSRRQWTGTLQTYPRAQYRAGALSDRSGGRAGSGARTRVGCGRLRPKPFSPREITARAWIARSTRTSKCSAGNYAYSRPTPIPFKPTVGSAIPCGRHDDPDAHFFGIPADCRRRFLLSGQSKPRRAETPLFGIDGGGAGRYGAFVGVGDRECHGRRADPRGNGKECVSRRIRSPFRCVDLQPEQKAAAALWRARKRWRPGARRAQAARA